MADQINLRSERSSAGVVTATFDAAGRSVNVWDQALFAALAALLDDLERDPPAAVVFRSAKPSGFLAGADLFWIAGMTTVAEVHALLRTGRELFARVAALPAPTFAALHGPCLGGGLEFALACTCRIARNDAATILGLPETQVGLIPGWGGTQSLPRRVGYAAAARMIAAGNPVAPAEALAIGLVDAVFPLETFDRDLADLVAARKGPRPSDHAAATPVDAAMAADHPAAAAALRAVAAGLRHGIERGLEAERDEFCRVLFDPECRARFDAFFERQRARKAARNP